MLDGPLCVCVYVCIPILESVTFYRQRRFQNFLNHINHSILLELIVRSYRQILFHVILFRLAPFYSLAREYWIEKNVQVNCDIHIWSSFFLPSSFVSRYSQNEKQNKKTHNICLEMEFVIIFDLLPVIFIWLWILFFLFIRTDNSLNVKCYQVSDLRSIQVCWYKFIFSSNDLFNDGSFIHSFVGSVPYDNVHTAFNHA